MKLKMLPIAIVSLCSVVLSGAALAQGNYRNGPQPPAGASRPSGDLNGVVMGPKDVPLGANVATLKLPDNYVYLNKDRANELLEKVGNKPLPGTLGLITERGLNEKDDWFVVMQYNDIGYMKDDEADRFNADDLMRQMKESAEQENPKRKEQGESTLTVVGWYKQPSYNRGTHVLSWSVLADESDGPTTERIINDTSVVLGRQGIMVCTAVGLADHADMLQQKLTTVGNVTTFNRGADYASFRSGDRIAELTMTGLVTGGAAAAAYGAAKLGLFAKLGGFLLLLKKGIIVVIAGIAAAVKKIWNKITGRSGESTSVA